MIVLGLNKAVASGDFFFSFRRGVHVHKKRVPFIQVSRDIFYHMYFSQVGGKSEGSHMQRGQQVSFFFFGRRALEPLKPGFEPK